MVTTELFKGEKEEREWKIVGPSSCTLHTHIHILVLISFCKQENNGYEDLNNLPKATQQEKKNAILFQICVCMTLEQVARTLLFKFLRPFPPLLPSPLLPPVLPPGRRNWRLGLLHVRRAVSSKDWEPPPGAQKAAFYKALPNSLWEVSPVHTRR